MALLVLSMGCTTEIQHDLTESQANEIVVALEEKGIEVHKSRDEIQKGQWVISVPDGVRVQAWNTLRSQGLPSPTVNGFGEFFPREGLVPTADEERVVMQYATAQELRQTLVAVDGIVDAHVNLVIPEKKRFALRGDQAPPAPRASVLLKHRARKDGNAPIALADVKRIVVGAVEGLDTDNVSVVLTAVDAAASDPSIRITSVGPVSVAEGNKSTLQSFIAVLMLAILMLAGALGAVVYKFRSQTV